MQTETMTPAIDMEKLADMLAERVMKTPRNAKAIWTCDEAANYLKVKRREVRDRISKHSSFPKPIQLPNGSGGHCERRWYAQEIIKWAEKHRS